MSERQQLIEIRDRLGARRASSLLRPLLVALLALFALSALAEESLTPGNAGGYFVVEDARAQFDALKAHPEALAWRNDESRGAPDPSIFDHYQGIVRHYSGAGRPTLYVTINDDDDGGRKGGYILVVSMGSRPPRGERLGSNLQDIGSDTEEEYPSPLDTWIRSIRLDGSLVFDGEPLPAYVHPGGMAIVDDVLFVPADQAADESAPIGQLLLFDLRGDRLNPRPLQALPLTHLIDNVAVTRLEDGSYLIWANGDGGAAIKVYRTTRTNLRDDELGLELVENWSAATGLVGGSEFPGGTSAHQSSTFLREPDGDLFLIGMRHPGGSPFDGSDFADLYGVTIKEGGGLELRLLRTKNLTCRYDGGGGLNPMRVCNMAAANNAYVSPTGELILYSMPHDDEDGFDPDIARMAEFRHRDVNRPGSPLRSSRVEARGPYTVDEGALVGLLGSGEGPLDRPWVDLYDDSGFEDRTIFVPYDQRGLMELDNFNDLDRFNDKTSAVRWRAPVGMSITLFDDDSFEDRRVVLFGTGRTEEVSSLENQGVVRGLVEQRDPDKDPGDALDFNDKTSSLRFNGSPPDPADFDLEWDLDGDGIFAESGASALYGDESGATPTFDASTLDGPSELSVTLRGVSPGNPSARDDALIVVRNVAPSVSIDVLEGGESGVGVVGCSVRLEGSFSDVPADTHRAEVDWADGSLLPAQLDAASSSVSAQHVYAEPGNYAVELAVSDDDGGVGRDREPISVFLDESAPLVSVEGVSQGSAAPQWLFPFELVIESSDEDGLPSAVVNERLTIEGCTVLDGDTFGDGDGLLSDESITVDRDFLCRARFSCAFDVLEAPTLAVEAEDCAGNVGRASLSFPFSLTLTAESCPTVERELRGGRGGGREQPRATPREPAAPTREPREGRRGSGLAERGTRAELPARDAARENGRERGVTERAPSGGEAKETEEQKPARDEREAGGRLLERTSGLSERTRGS